MGTIDLQTSPGAVLGTVEYMSPEQASGASIDFRSDQFSFGLVLYEMVTGKQAYQRNTKPETLVAIIREAPEPIGSLSPDVPIPLCWVIERCLARDPAQRNGDIRRQRTDGLRCFPNNGNKRLRFRVPLIGLFSGHHLVKHQAERELV